MEKKEVSCQDQDRIRKIIIRYEEYIIWNISDESLNIVIFDLSPSEKEWIEGLSVDGSPEVDFLKWLNTEDSSHSDCSLLASAANKGLPIARLILNFNKDEKEKTIEWLDNAAQQGDQIAQVIVGGMYLDGTGGKEVNKKKSIELFTKTAEKHSTHGQFALGYCFLSGSGVEKNVSEGIEWIRKASDSGSLIASCIMANGYMFGEYGICQDYSKAYKYLSKLEGHRVYDFTESHVGYLAALYYFGLGVPTDKEKAIEMFGSVNIDLSPSPESPLWVKELALCFSNGILDGSQMSSEETAQLLDSLVRLLRLFREYTLTTYSFSDFNYMKDLDIDFKRLRPRVKDLWKSMKEYDGDLWKILRYADIASPDVLMDALEEDDYDKFYSCYQKEPEKFPALAYFFLNSMNSLKNIENQTQDQLRNTMKVEKEFVNAAAEVIECHEGLEVVNNFSDFLEDDNPPSHRRYEINLGVVKFILPICYDIVEDKDNDHRGQHIVRAIKEIFESPLFERFQVKQYVESLIKATTPQEEQEKKKSGRGKPKAKWLMIDQKITNEDFGKLIEKNVWTGLYGKIEKFLLTETLKNGKQKVLSEKKSKSVLKILGACFIYYCLEKNGIAKKWGETGTKEAFGKVMRFLHVSKNSIDKYMSLFERYDMVVRQSLKDENLFGDIVPFQTVDEGGMITYKPKKGKKLTANDEELINRVKEKIREDEINKTDYYNILRHNFDKFNPIITSTENDLKETFHSFFPA